MLGGLSRTVVAAGVAVLALGGVALAQGAAKRAITQISGDLYRFQNNFHYSVFLVTPDGVIVTDPINAEAAAWLRDRIKERFGKPIRYLILSHDHRDHSSGGEVFKAAGAIVVAHARAKATIIAELRPTAVPDITFERAMTIELGGARVELSHLGRNHSDNMIVMNFPAERVLFAVDFIPVQTVAFKTLSDGYLPDWISSLRRVEGMDFDVLAPGHGPMGGKADVTAFREYMEDLYSQVLAAVRAGMTLEETQAAVDLSKYAEWGGYEAWAPMNIAGVYREISTYRVGNPG